MSYYAGYCSYEEESVSSSVYCNCPAYQDDGDNLCDSSFLVPSCALTPIGDGGMDVTTAYMASAVAPLGCDDPTSIPDDNIFAPDIDFVPDDPDVNILPS